MSRVRDLLRVEPGSTVVLQDAAAREHPGVDGGKKAGRAEVAALAPRLAELQEMLYAQGRTGGQRRLVVLLQGTDTSGKDGAVKGVLGLVNPAGVRVTSFGKPTPEELAHDFLWRFDRALPEAGGIAAWNRSPYEDVLVVRVHDLVPREEWETRYDRINAWEAELAASGVVLLKVFLHLSYEEQGERLLARLDDPAKHWKVEPGDLAERAHWEAYREAYTAVLERCSTDVSPWYRVPADRKWYRDWALAHLLLETLEDLQLTWPERPELDLDALRAELQASRGAEREQGS